MSRVLFFLLISHSIHGASLHGHLQRVLLWELPLEVWQVVLGYCSCREYARLLGLQHGRFEGGAEDQEGEEGEVKEERGEVEGTAGEGEDWWPNPVSSEFYHLLKHSLVEMRIVGMLPSACMGGLWLASRDWQALSIRSILLGLSLVLFSFLAVAPLLIFSLSRALSPPQTSRRRTKM